VRRIGLAVVVVLSLLVAPLGGLAQQSQPANLPRIGYLFLQPFSASAHLRDAFRQGLRELGYAEGQNIAIEFRNAEGRPERLLDLATELVRLKVDVIVAAPEASVEAAKHATKAIPIVMFASTTNLQPEMFPPVTVIVPTILGTLGSLVTSRVTL
jgi:putative ABC transport system substrate-binding protein